MNSINLVLPASNEEITVIVSRKKIRNVRLKVFPDLRVAISVPQNIPNVWLDQYLKEKSPWIEDRLSFFKKTTGYEAIRVVKSGTSTKILGREVIILIEQNSSKIVYREEDNIIVKTLNKSDQAIISTQFDEWWKIQAKLYYESTLFKLYPIIGKYNHPKPSLYVRKMKTLWGSYSIAKNKITINHFLYKAPPPCIEYVMLHELIHALYPKHNTEFYNFLSVQMPDWKERKRILDHEVVQGL